MTVNGSVERQCQPRALDGGTSERAPGAHGEGVVVPDHVEGLDQLDGDHGLRHRVRAEVAPRVTPDCHPSEGASKK